MPTPSQLAPRTFQAHRALERLLSLGTGRALTLAADLVKPSWVRELIAADGRAAEISGPSLYWMLGPDGMEPWPSLLFVAKRRPRWEGDPPKAAAIALFVGLSGELAAQTWPHDRTRADRVAPLPEANTPGAGPGV